MDIEQLPDDGHIKLFEAAKALDISADALLGLTKKRKAITLFVEDCCYCDLGLSEHAKPLPEQQSYWLGAERLTPEQWVELDAAYVYCGNYYLPLMESDIEEIREGFFTLTTTMFGSCGDPLFEYRPFFYDTTSLDNRVFSFTLPYLEQYFELEAPPFYHHQKTSKGCGVKISPSLLFIRSYELKQLKSFIDEETLSSLPPEALHYPGKYEGGMPNNIYCGWDSIKAAWKSYGQKEVSDRQMKNYEEQGLDVQHAKRGKIDIPILTDQAIRNFIYKREMEKQKKQKK